MKKHKVEEKKENHKFERFSSLYPLIMKAYFAFIFLVAFFTFYHIGYSNKIIPGVKIGNVFVGGMSYKEAEEALSKYVSTLNPNIVLSYEGFRHEITPDHVELKYNVQASVARAFEIGRTGNIFVDGKDKIASLVKTITLKANYQLNNDVLNREFEQVRGEINATAAEPKFYLDENGIVQISEPNTGKKLNDQHLYDSVIGSYDKMHFDEVKLSVDKTDSTLTVKDLELLRDEVTEILNKNMTITYERNTWTLTPSEKLDILRVQKESDSSVKLAINNPSLDSYANYISRQINKSPRGKVTKYEDGVVAGFEITQEGEEVNGNKFSRDLEDMFFGKRESVAVETTKVQSFTDTSKYGIFALLGRGESSFAGSSRARIKNLTLAAERTDGVLVPPGGVYSFNNSVGEISGASGYDTAYIISNGKTILGEGGGVCQTSTTLFRSVLNSGLPVVARYPHAYRVYYYEIDEPAGFDASIYQPSLDFQFRNDTPNYVLVESSWDLGQQKLYFDIYGTPDGREVELTEPVVTNFIKPPEPLYQDDGSLPKGTKKQIDFEAWGATSQFSTTVKRDGEVIHSANYKSVYQPWRAVYLVGTKEN